MTEGRRTKGRSYVTDHEHAVVMICVDFLALCIALPLGLLVLAALSPVKTNSLSHFTQNAANDCLFPLAVIIALAASGSYRSVRRALQPSTFTELKDLIFAIGAGCILLLTVGAIGHAIFRTSELSTTQLLAAVLIAACTVPAGRALLRAWVQTFTETRVIVVGTGPMSERIGVHLSLQKGMQMVGRVVDSSEVEPGAIGTVTDLPRICNELGIDRVIIAAGHAGPESIAAYRAIQDQVRIALVPHHYELIAWGAKLTELLGLPMLEFAPPHMSASDRAAKRTLDIAASVVALILLSPVLLAIGLIVRTTSSGPALFRQERLGRHRHPFVINKFRTMTAVTVDRNPESGHGVEPAQRGERNPLWASRSKEGERHRVTRVGSFLRKTGLDELPQLVNVLGGSMSLVGPRPFVRHESDHSDDWTARRYEVRPGITGLWQVSGRNELSAEDLRELDYLYVMSWSMSWDMKIIFDTPRAMVRGLGAY